MLRLSKKADYALMAMKHLALRGDRSSHATASAREIAELYDIPIELMAKVLQRLVRRGLLASQQGTRGGYQLARTPTLISVADVIQAIDGPLVRPKKALASSSPSATCATRCGAYASGFCRRSASARSPSSLPRCPRQRRRRPRRIRRYCIRICDENVGRVLRPAKEKRQ
ncbi:MAG: hypothetical protein DMG03_15490 [Acidobacteria bacterium]|nr:MAG: hypothetical protein DMG03_15490 [Acidobacteriota bacterium]